ncbi:MAG: nucleotidyltransferase family protein [Candidatus Riflebacteria bacterium]|nr:nucleotidyltransferase family protein [Candidatus Riflebacteria bacterium]
MQYRRDEILRMLQQHGDTIRSYDVRSLSVFGSAARDECSEGSDLDLLVEFQKKSFDAYMDLRDFLQQLFGCKVDLVPVDCVKPRLRPHVLAEAIRVPGL